jgi:hypothetical protein
MAAVDILRQRVGLAESVGPFPEVLGQDRHQRVGLRRGQRGRIDRAPPLQNARHLSVRIHGGEHALVGGDALGDPVGGAVRRVAPHHGFQKERRLREEQVVVGGDGGGRRPLEDADDGRPRRLGEAAVLLRRGRADGELGTQRQVQRAAGLGGQGDRDGVRRDAGRLRRRHALHVGKQVVGPAVGGEGEVVGDAAGLVDARAVGLGLEDLVGVAAGAQGTRQRGRHPLREGLFKRGERVARVGDALGGHLQADRAVGERRGGDVLAQGLVGEAVEDARPDC